MIGRELRCLLLLSLFSLSGCGLAKTLFPATTPEDLSGNWQFSSTNTTPTTANNIVLVGALVSNGANVTGTLRFTDIAPGNACGAVGQVFNFTGSIDDTLPTAQVLNLHSAVAGSTIAIQVNLNAHLQGIAAGTATITGPTCTFASSPLAAIQYPPVTGTFTGPLTPVTSIPANAAQAGTGTLTVTQASTPNTDGSFSLTGSLTFAGASCTSTIGVTGTTLGPAVTLASAVNSISNPSLITFAGSNTPLSAQIATPQLQSGAIVYYPPPCSPTLTTTATYSATLAKQ